MVQEVKHNTQVSGQERNEKLMYDKEAKSIQ